MLERIATPSHGDVRWSPRARPLVAALVLGLALALAMTACGSGPPIRGASAPHATATPASTATPSPAPPSACNEALLRYGWAIHRVGDLLIAGSYLGIPSRKMADAAPLQPQLFPDPNDQALINRRFPLQPLTNPMEGGGFALALCDASTTQSHEIEGATFGIAQFTPYTGRVQTWSGCDGYYSRSEPGGAAGYGCGFGFQADEILHVTFSIPAAGSVASAIQVGFGPPTAPPRPTPYGPLPATLGPGQDMVFLVTVKLPSTPGTYAFTVAPSVDHAALAPLPIGESALFAPGAVRWGGLACLHPAMQSHIPPATNPPSYYICPG
jgi:hypothetical protein